MENDVVMCPKCGFKLPKVMGYVGKIHCGCGKVVFDTTGPVC